MYKVKMQYENHGIKTVVEGKAIQWYKHKVILKKIAKIIL